MNIYECITARICARLQDGVAPWHRPWSGGALPKNLYSQQPYRGVNVWLLAAQPCASPYWATFRQVQAIGGRIRRDAHGTPVVFWKVKSPNPCKVARQQTQHFCGRVRQGWSLTSSHPVRPA